MAYTEKWHAAGDFYVSQKFGDDADAGTSDAPVSSISAALPNFDNIGNDLTVGVIKAGVYQEDILMLHGVIHLIGDGNVKLAGGGTRTINNTSNSGTQGFQFENLKIDFYTSLERSCGINTTYSRISSMAAIGGFNCSYFQVDSYAPVDIANNKFRAFHSDFFYCNYIETKIVRTNSTPRFLNCFFDASSSISKTNQNYSSTYVFENCVFQVDYNGNSFTIEGQDVRDFKNTYPDQFKRCIFLENEEAGFNNLSSNPDLMDLTLKYSPRSKLYLGSGVFAGAHTFARPVTGEHSTFASAADSNNPVVDTLDPLLENIDSFNADGTVVWKQGFSSGTIRPSGRAGSRLAFPFAKFVDTPVSFGGAFYRPGAAIDDDAADDRASYKVRIIDPETGDWLPSASTWYRMAVNQPWQIDAGGRGNGDPQFDFTTANYLRCKEYQVELQVNDISI
ncbi:MAG TPA: hypothetical protein DCR93_10350 [Cytophagales bacterium]|nr:hypothetical protein [Cytophagales bacterium]